MSIKTINVFLDTSALRKDPLLNKTEEGRWLYHLGNTGAIKIHLPKMVESEIISFFDTISESKTIESSILMKKIENLCDLKTAEKVKFLIDDSLCKHNESRRKNLIELLGLPFIKIEKSHKTYVDEVFEDYFQGRANFINKNKKDHLPDAFIHHFIKNFKDEIHCVIADNNLRNSCIGMKHVSNYETIADFLKQPVIEAKINEFNESPKHNLKRSVLKYFYDLNNTSIPDHPFNISDYLAVRLGCVEQHLEDIFRTNSYIIEKIHSLNILNTDEIVYELSPDDSLLATFNIYVMGSIRSSQPIFPDYPLNNNNIRSLKLRYNSSIQEFTTKIRFKLSLELDKSKLNDLVNDAIDDHKNFIKYNFQENLQNIKSLYQEEFIKILETDVKEITITYSDGRMNKFMGGRLVESKSGR